MSSITTSSSSSPTHGRRISRFRLTEPSGSAQEPIKRSHLTEKVRSEIDRVRRDDTLAWMAHSVWLSLWSLVIACMLVLLGVGAIVAVLLGSLPVVVTQTNSSLVVTTVGAAFALALPAGVIAYGVTRSLHPEPIHRGRPIRGPAIGVVVALAVALAATAVAMPWSFPSPNVLHDSAHQISTLVEDHEIVAGTAYQEPNGRDLYFEVTIGAWIVTPFTSIRPGSVYDEVVRAAGARPIANIAKVANAIGSAQVDALRSRMLHLWELAGALCLLAIAAFAYQRRAWRKPILAPPLEDDRVREILARLRNVEPRTEFT